MTIDAGPADVKPKVEASEVISLKVQEASGDAPIVFKVRVRNYQEAGTNILKLPILPYASASTRHLSAVDALPQITIATDCSCVP